MDKNKFYEPPINWSDYEDIALALYEKFGDDFNESKIYRIRFTDLLDWVNFGIFGPIDKVLFFIRYFG